MGKRVVTEWSWQAGRARGGGAAGARDGVAGRLSLGYVFLKVDSVLGLVGGEVHEGRGHCLGPLDELGVSEGCSNVEPLASYLGVGNGVLVNGVLEQRPLPPADKQEDESSLCGSGVTRTLLQVPTEGSCNGF